MSYPVYTVPAGTTLYHFFNTFASATGAPITLTGLAVGDIKVYKNGSVTQRSSTAGFTLLDTDGTDFDGITGLHGFSLDLSDNTDAGFYAAGSWYHVVVDAVTVDSQTMSFVACAFRVVAAESVAGTPRADATHFAGTAYATALAAEVDAMHDEVVENSKTFRQMFRLMYAVLCNKVSGMGTTGVAFRDDADTKDRVSATVDALGNRSAVTKDGT